MVVRLRTFKSQQAIYQAKLCYRTLWSNVHIDIQGFPINAYVCNMALKKEFPKMFMRISDEILRGFFVNYKSIT